MRVAEHHVPDVEVEQLRKVAVLVAREAAELARSSRQAAVTDVGTKTTDTDVVTAADLACERLIRGRLAELRPGEPLLGEEEGGSEAPTPGLRWVVDPIDGTVNYLYGFPWYAVSVAVQLDGVSLAGAVVEPVSGRTWTAARGQGAHLDGVPLAVSRVERLDLAMVSTGFGYQAEQRQRQAAVVSRLIGRIRDIRRAGAASLDLCAVAAGWVDAYVEHGLHRWDWAAGGLIAEEAGAVVLLPTAELDGLGPGVTFAAAPGVAQPLREALVECGLRQV